MANKNMTFSASLRLNSKDFKKGVADVQRSLKSLQSSFLGLAGALGLGLSFSKLGSSLMDTAVKLSTAQNVLKNVSKELGEYGENIVWLKRISGEYGQDLITLTNSFAKFRAAASSSNLTLQQQRDIYEALTRAAGAYHLSADQVGNVMMAVEQMISKAKVTSEELRRQLSNSLPGSYNLMAQAAYDAGVITEASAAKLEEAMKKGQVAADKVLPHFAKVLNDVTANADFDSLQTSMNRLKNSWTEMVEAGNFEKMYKGIIDGANAVVKYFTESFWVKIAAGAALVLGTAGAPRLLKWGKNFIDESKNIADVAAKNFNRISESMYETSKRAEALGVTLNRVSRNGLTVVSESKSRMLGKTIAGVDVDTQRLNERTLAARAYAKQLKEARDAAIKFNNTQLERNVAYKTATGKDWLTPQQVAAYRDANRELEKLNNQFKRQGIEGNVAAGAVQKLKGLWSSFLGILKSALASLAIGAIIGGLTFIISKVIEARKEAKRIASIADDMVNAVEKAGGENSKTLIQLTQIKRALQDIDETTDTAKKAQLINEVNKALGRTGKELLTVKSDIQNEVLPAIDQYIEKIKHLAKQQAILALVSEKTSKVIQLEAENAAMTENPNWGQTTTVRNIGGSPMLGGTTSSVYEAPTEEARKLKESVDKNNSEITELNNGIDRILKMADEDTLKAIYAGSDTVTSGGTGGGGGGSGKQKTPQSELDEYLKNAKELENQYHNGALTAEEYKKELIKLRENSYKTLAAFGEWSNVLNRLNGTGKTAANQLQTQFKLDLVMDDEDEIEEFDKEMAEEADRALKKFREAWDKYIEYVKDKPISEKVDTEDAYLKSNRKRKGQTFTEKEEYLNKQSLSSYEKDIENLTNYKKKLEEALKTETNEQALARMKTLLDGIIDSLERLKGVTADLKRKVQIAELEKQIKDLKQQGIDSVFTSITTLSSGMDNLYRAYQSIQQINDSTWKSEELEEFLTVMNAIVQTMEVLKSIYVALEAVTKAYTAIKEKSAAKAAIANQIEATSEIEKGTAAAGAAAAGGASSVASIPFVGPALAVAAVAAIVAAILAANSKVKKFARGGFVGGASYSGDKVPAMVNSGELVLNPAQQRNLLNLANGKTGTGGGKVEFRISGADLVGTLNNYERLRK